jgi:hypothetical protein
VLLGTEKPFTPFTLTFNMAPKPIKFTQKELDQISIMAGLGLTIERIALILGISPATFYRKKKLVPDVKQAYETGLAKSEYTISKTLFEMATQDRNLPAIIWWEKTRFGRTERIETKQSIEVEGEKQQQVLIYLPENSRDSETPSA